MRRAITISLTLGLCVLLATVLLLEIRDVPQLSAIKKSFRSENLTILDRKGLVIDEIHSPQKVRRLNWVGLDEVPPSFIEAVLKNEDWRFSKDSITRQLAQSRFWPSIALEMVWSKRQILEAYINLSVYRGELQGVAAASQALFDRPPEKLTRPQSAVLASLIRSRSRGVDGVRSKACALLKSMDAGEECGLINAQHLSNLERSFQVGPFVKMAPHVAQLLGNLPDLREGNVVHSTLDRDLQWTVLNALQKRDISEGAAVVIENATGHVLAYVGNVGDSSRDLAMRPRPSGGSLKPFLFAKALDERTLTATTLIQDKPEEVRLQAALTGSLKLPLVYALDTLGAETFVATLKSLGFTQLENADVYGPSLALGSAEVKLLELTNAYRTLANRGYWTPVRFSPGATSDEASRAVFSEGAAYIVSTMMQSLNPWRALLCDQWCIGFSEKYTIGVLNGGKEAWQEIFQALDQNEQSAPPAPPADVQEVGGDLYLKGTFNEVTALVRPPAGVGSRISYPVDAGVIPINPLADGGKIFLQVSAPGPDQNLFLDGKRLGRARTLQQWRPTPGRHQLELRDAKGRSLHKVNFQVRHPRQ